LQDNAVCGFNTSASSIIHNTVYVIHVLTSRCP
jgi:hypothetical protein